MNGKCVRGKASIKKCFGTGGLKTECADCKNGEECESGKCWGSKCVIKDSFASIEKCFGLKKECEICTTSDECSTMKCWGIGGTKRCIVSGSASSVAKCFKDH